LDKFYTVGVRDDLLCNREFDETQHSESDTLLKPIFIRPVHIYSDLCAIQNKIYRRNLLTTCVSVKIGPENTAFIQGDQKVSVHLIITIQKVTSNVQSVPRQSPYIC
jgi:hypothetical protein